MCLTTFLFLLFYYLTLVFYFGFWFNSKNAAVTEHPRGFRRVFDKESVMQDSLIRFSKYLIACCTAKIKIGYHDTIQTSPHPPIILVVDVLVVITIIVANTNTMIFVTFIKLLSFLS